MNFLTAQWKNLVMANYIVQPAVLQKYLPAGTELDYFNGNCYVSLVGFMFEDTKVLGVKIPNHTHFEEVNLRFYVKRFENGEWRRGVVFIKEIVPKSAITFIANTLYKEHYETQTMNHNIKLEAEILNVCYNWNQKNSTNKIEVNAYDFLSPLDPESEAEFIMEHYYGYTKYAKNTTYEYEVQHPKWEQYTIKNYHIAVDFEKNYGKEFRFLNTVKPCSVYLAKGSVITVKNKRKINIYDPF
ncbi:YqjF family protein [Flavobacterium covae]|uniref:YqjF family protein n=1 Tax=Flavobacterium covae TaxID=2906076 RepID=UPI0035E463A5